MKTVRLTKKYLDFIAKSKQIQGRQNPTPNGHAWCYIVFNAPIPDGTATRHSDIINDNTQLPAYNLKTDIHGRLTTDYTSIHSNIPVTLYSLEDKYGTCDVPDDIFNMFNGSVLEEVV